MQTASALQAISRKLRAKSTFAIGEGLRLQEVAAGLGVAAQAPGGHDQEVEVVVEGLAPVGGDALAEGAERLGVVAGAVEGASGFRVPPMW